MLDVIAYGAGEFFGSTCEWLQQRFYIVFVADSDELKQGKQINGITCISPDEVLEKKMPVIITMTKGEAVYAIRKWLADNNIEEINIYNTKVASGKKIVLFGNEDVCQFFHCKLLAVEPESNVLGYCTGISKDNERCFVSGKKIFSVSEVETMMFNHEIDRIIEVADGAELIFKSYKAFKSDIVLSDKFFLSRKEAARNPHFSPDVSDLFTRYTEGHRLGVVQFLLSPGCNLNCRLCSHFAALVPNGEFYSFGQFQSDIERLKHLIDVECIDLWGGEALLTPNLEQYIYKAREVFPESNIQIGTNGILLSSLSDHLISAIKETNAVIAVSIYPPLKAKVEESVKGLQDLGLHLVVIDNIEEKTFFTKSYNLEGKRNFIEAYEECQSKQCHTIFNGKLAGCYLPITAPYFNRYFGTNGFDTAGDVIDIYNSELTAEKLMIALHSPMNSCRYCYPISNEKWRQVEGKSEFEDWVY